MRFLSCAVGSVVIVLWFASPALAGNWGEDWGTMVWEAALVGVPTLGLFGVGLLVLLLGVSTVGFLRRRAWVMAALFVLLTVPLVAAASTIAGLNVFANGEAADANEVNENFQIVRIAVNDNDVGVQAVVVVEARTRSGSLVTARHALDQGVEVMAVPGPVGVPPSEGPNRLLLDGARPCLGGADLLEALGLEASEPGAAPTHSAESLAPEAQRVLEALAYEPASRDELAQRLELAAGALAAPLLELELAGRVVHDRDGKLRVLSKRG